MNSVSQCSKTGKNTKKNMLVMWATRLLNCSGRLKPLTLAIGYSTIQAGLDINVCPIPVKTDVGQVDLV